MKIAIIYDMIYPYNIGGAELRNYEIAKRLAYRHDVHMFGVKLWSGPDILKKDGITIHGVCCYNDKLNFSGSRTIFESIWFGLKLIKPLAREKFDIIDVSAFAYLHCFTASLVAKINKTPLVFTWHQYWGNYWQEYLGGIKGWGGSRLENLVKYLGRHHVAVSETTRSDLIHNGVATEQIFVNFCGVDLKKVNSLKSGEKVYDIIFVGRLTHQKNVALLIKAVKILSQYWPEIKICLVGDGVEKARLHELVTQLGISNNIILKGLLDQREEVFAELKKAKIFVLPSLLEGFGIVVIEANACGLPVIVIKNKWNAAQELIEVNKTGLISENTAESLAERIKQLLEDDNLRHQMSEAAIKKAIDFDWNIIANKIEKYYLTVIEDENSTQN